MAQDFVIGDQLLRDAKAHDMNISGWLEHLDPTDSYPEHERNLDAFQRQLARLDIKTASDDKTGIQAHTFSRFFENPADKNEEGKFLAQEWCMRQYRVFSNYFETHQWNDYRPREFQRLFDTEAPLSFTLYQPAVLPELRFIQIQPSMLSELIARSRTVAAENFYALYLNDSAATPEARFYRVEEGGEIPVVTFDTSDHLIRNYKYGRRLRQTYEQMRRLSMDMVSWAIMYIAARAARDKEDAVLNTLVNGDGNTSTAATANSGSTYDSGAGGTVSLKMWENWRLQAFIRPYILTTIIAHPTAITLVHLLSVGTSNMPPAWFQQLNEVNANRFTMTRTTLDGVRVVDNLTVPTTQIIGIDKRYAVELINEANADIVEMDRVISRQYSDIALSENVGYAIATLNQNQILNYTV